MELNTIDGNSIKNKGHTSLQTYMPSKPKKVGILVYGITGVLHDYLHSF